MFKKKKKEENLNYMQTHSCVYIIYLREIWR